MNEAAKLTIKNKKDTNATLSISNQNNIYVDISYMHPPIIIYDFFLDPNMTKLSLKIPYSSLMLHGNTIKEVQYCESLGSS